MTFWDDLARLETRMRELAALLEGAQTDPMALDRAWRGCEEHAPAVVSAAANVEGKGGNGAVRAQLVRLVELNAIAVETAQRAQESISTELERVKLARSRLDGHAGRARSGETGASCDVTS